MRKNNPPEKKSKRFSYWEGWTLVDNNGKCLFNIPETTKDTIRQLREEVVKGNIDAIPELLSLDPDAIKEYSVNMWISRIKKVSTYDNLSKERWERIEKALHGDMRGKRDTKTTVRRDIEDFKEMVSQRLQGATVQDLIEDPTDALVWNHYVKIAKLILRGLGGSEESKENWEQVFSILSIMQENIDQPFCVRYFRMGCLSKGNQW